MSKYTDDTWKFLIHIYMFKLCLILKIGTSYRSEIKKLLFLDTSKEITNRFCKKSGFFSLLLVFDYICLNWSYVDRQKVNIC